MPLESKINKYINRWVVYTKKFKDLFKGSANMARGMGHWNLYNFRIAITYGISFIRLKLQNWNTDKL